MYVDPTTYFLGCILCQLPGSNTFATIPMLTEIAAGTHLTEQHVIFRRSLDQVKSRMTDSDMKLHEKLVVAE